MAYQFFQPNPHNKSVGDCVIRALCKALNIDWYAAYTDLIVQGYAMCDMPSSNAVWGQYLQSQGFRRYIVPDTCPNCYTIEDFCRDNPVGTFVLCTGTHAVTAQDGCYFDIWDSGREVVQYFWKKE